MAIFPEQINGNYYAIHRPVSPLFKSYAIWIAASPDLTCWGKHRCLLQPRPGFWDETKIGAGAAPVRIEPGWLEIYHGADHNNRYCLGAVLLDAEKPWKVIARTQKPILEPQTDYECQGFFGNVVFSCGLLCEQERLRIYYGAADSVICYAELSLKETIENLNLSSRQGI